MAFLFNGRKAKRASASDRRRHLLLSVRGADGRDSGCSTGVTTDKRDVEVRRGVQCGTAQKADVVNVSNARCRLPVSLASCSPTSAADDNRVNTSGEAALRR
jgi:hypothetical protein